MMDDLHHHFINCRKKKPFWKTLKLWKRNVIEIDLNESDLDILLGIHNPNDDLYINFINFVNLNAKNYIRENENEEIFVNVFLINLKENVASIKCDKLKLLFDECL